MDLREDRRAFSEKPLQGRAHDLDAALYSPKGRLQPARSGRAGVRHLADDQVMAPSGEWMKRSEWERRNG